MQESFLRICSTETLFWVSCKSTGYPNILTQFETDIRETSHEKSWVWQFLPGSARHAPGRKFQEKDITIGNILLIGIVGELERSELNWTEIKWNEGTHARRILNEWMHACMNQWNERNKCMHGWMNAWMTEWTNERRKEGMNEGSSSGIYNVIMASIARRCSVAAAKISPLAASRPSWPEISDSCRRWP